MARSRHKAETAPPTKRRSRNLARQGRKRAITRPSTKFTIQYFRKGKRTKTLRFDLSSFKEARKVARIAGDFADTEVHSFTIAADNGRTETWFYLDGTWRQKRR